MNDELLVELQRLEALLHTNEVRQDPEALAALLHPDFEEFGRSGRRYSRCEVLAEFTDGACLPKVQAESYEVSLIGEGVALLTYTSAHAAEGPTRRATLRSSLWVLSRGKWRLRFHQGTPVHT
ncbi:MAG: nuclear transport factor 2 family protein [Candidatus Competibacteraceae bacterium]|nr:nuclear transport factor 2 family protein [Candidatus Competibacteraceae bacterium]MBK7983502.1 nuclear transport factor 2 family protein [Candidatus Competibacteraceae bacterium]